MLLFVMLCEGALSFECVDAILEYDLYIECYLSTVLFIMLYVCGMKSLSVTIQMKASEKNCVTVYYAVQSGSNL